jgi:IS5 family transposase
MEKLTGRKHRNGICDRGYRGERKYFCKRAGFEPVIGHLKEDHRLSRNYDKGIIGDEINVMLAATAFNFKRMINK